MAEQSDTSGSGHGEFPISADTVLSIVTRIVVSTLKSSGNEKTAELIEKWPEKIGGVLGPKLKPVLDKLKKGQKVTSAEIKVVDEAVATDHREAMTIFGSVVASAVDETLDAKAETQKMLNSYNSIFVIICEMMTKAQTSYALRGFIQGTNCISYWHITGKQPRFLISGDHLYAIDFELYLLQSEPKPALLRTLNEQIRRSPARHLAFELYDYRHTDGIELVKQVRELYVDIETLHPDRAALENEPNDSFQITDYTRPIAFTYEIPLESTGLTALLESVFEAKAIQDVAKRRSHEEEEEASRIRTRHSGLT